MSVVRGSVRCKGEINAGHLAKRIEKTLSQSRSRDVQREDLVVKFRLNPKGLTGRVARAENSIIQFPVPFESGELRIEAADEGIEVFYQVDLKFSEVAAALICFLGFLPLLINAPNVPFFGAVGLSLFMLFFLIAGNRAGAASQIRKMVVDVT